MDENERNKRSVKQGYELKDVEQDLRYVKDKLRDFSVTVYGRRDKAQPEGLVHEVGKNSDFRQNATKWLWIVFTQVTVIIIYLLYEAVR